MISTLLFQSSDSSSSGSNAVDPSQVTGWDVLGAAAVIALAVPVAALLARLLMRGVRRLPNVTEPLVQDIGRLIRWSVYLIAFALAMTFLGVTVGWLSIVVIVILILGLLMVRPMVENIAAGLLMTVRPSFSIGDQIQTDEYKGVVSEIGSRTTILKTNTGISIHIPNVEVADKVIAVYSAYDSRRAGFNLSVDHDTDLTALTTDLVKAISNIDDIESDPAPSVQATGYNGRSIDLSIEFWYPSSHHSDSGPMDLVVRTVQTELTKAGIVPVAKTVDIVQSQHAIKDSSPSNANSDPDSGAASTDESTTA